jgi:TolB-like protein/Tfp pilus assembly protein PilF
MRIAELIQEARRRHVFRTGAAYLVAAWILIEIAQLLLEAFEAPRTLLRMVIIVLAAGFPVTLFLSWTFGITPDGIKFEDELDRDMPDSEHDHRWTLVISMMVVIVVALVGIGRYLLPEEGAEPVAVPTLSADGRVSIAVLPFANMSADEENAFFADGISEELLNLLAGIEQLAVASRTSAFSFKGDEVPISEIAAQLGVQHVLEGSVRRSEGRVRITAQLIHAGSDRHLWSQTYDREMEDIFAIQDEIATEIVNALRGELGIEESGEVVSHDRPTADLNAYDLFLSGRELWRLRGKGNLEQAMALLKQAVDMDPEFSEAWSMLAASYVIYPAWSGTSQEFWSPLAAEAARRAIATDPEDAMAHAVLGTVEMGSGEMAEAITLMRRARELDPFGVTFHQWTGEQSLFLGYTHDADQSFRVASALDPLAPQVYFLGSTVADQQGDMQAALDRERRARELGAEEALTYIFQTPLLTGDYPRAREILEGGREHLERRANALDYTALSAIVDALEDPSLAPAAVAEIQRSTEANGHIDPTAIRVLGLLGEYDAAVGLIEEFGERNRTWLVQLWAADSDLVTDPRVIEILSASRLMEVWAALGPPDRCDITEGVLSCR